MGRVRQQETINQPSMVVLAIFHVRTAPSLTLLCSSGLWKLLRLIASLHSDDSSCSDSLGEKYMNHICCWKNYGTIVASRFYWRHRAIYLRRGFLLPVLPFA
jgi:hypothetical protein